MLERVVDERLAPRVDRDRVYRRVIKICGRTESEVEEVTFPIYGPWLSQPLPVVTTVLTAPAQVELHLSVRAGAAGDAKARLDAAYSRSPTPSGPTPSASTAGHWRRRLAISCACAVCGLGLPNPARAA